MFIAQPRHFLGANRTPCWVVGVPDPPTPQTKPVELVGGEMDRQWAVTMLIYNLRHNGFQFEIPAGHRRERENHLQMCGIENHQLIRQPRSSHRQLRESSGIVGPIGTCTCTALGLALTRSLLGLASMQNMGRVLVPSANMSLSVPQSGDDAAALRVNVLSVLSLALKSLHMPTVQLFIVQEMVFKIHFNFNFRYLANLSIDPCYS